MGKYCDFDCQKAAGFYERDIQRKVQRDTLRRAHTTIS